MDIESHEDSNISNDAVPNLNLQRVFGSQQEERSHEMSGEKVKQEDQGREGNDPSSNKQGTTTPKVRVIPVITQGNTQTSEYSVHHVYVMC